MAPPDLTNVLPPLYARWMGELLQGPLPDESRCTCEDCAVARKPGVEVTVVEKGKPPRFDSRPFDPHLKCCTVTPKLANFLVGSALADPELSAVGRESLQRRIASRQAVTPFGLGQVNAGHLEYRTRISAEFGLSRDLLCPHYAVEADNCGIWKHRNGVCSSYFCRPARGMAGSAFWLGGFRPLSKVLEPALSQWAAREVGLPDSCLVAMFDFRTHGEAATYSDLCTREGEPDDAAYAAAWGPWRGREPEFYRACAERVGGLSFQRVVEICGAEVAAHAAVTLAHYRQLRPAPVPRRLRINWGGFYWMDGTEHGGGPDRYLTYNTYDFVELPRPLSQALLLFTGEADTDDVLRQAQAQGAAFTPDILEDLISHRVLEDAAPAAP